MRGGDAAVRIVTALIVGAGPGLSTSFARVLAGAGYHVALAARKTEKLAGLASEIGASVHECDATDPAAVTALLPPCRILSSTLANFGRACC